MIGSKINQLFDLRSAKNALAEQIKALNIQIEELTLSIIDDMKEAGIDTARSDKGSVFFKISIYPQIDDKESFVKWVVQHDRYDMLQKRVSPGPILEMFDKENKLPKGISTYIKEDLNVRSKK